MKIHNNSPYQQLPEQGSKQKKTPTFRQFFRFFVTLPINWTKKLLGLHTPSPHYLRCLKETGKELGEGAAGKVTIVETEGLWLAHKSQKYPAVESELPKEAHILAKLDHPCIIKSYGDPDDETIISIHEQALNKELEPTSSVEDTEYILIESVEEKEAGLQTEIAECSLTEKIPTLSSKERLRQSLNALSAVSYLHQQKYCHFDIKPDNFLWLEDRIKLCDFGTAQQGDTSDFVPIGRDGCFLTPGYGPPELVHLFNNRNAPPVNGILCDSWSLGCTLAEIITGEAIFDPADYFDGWLLSEKDIPFDSKIEQYLQRHKENLPPKVEPILRGLLHTDPKKRMTVQQALALFPECNL